MKGICKKGQSCSLSHAKWSAIGEFADVKNSID
jgi:hypothetical protein